MVCQAPFTQRNNTLDTDSDIVFNQNMKTKEAIEFFRTEAFLARCLGIKRQAVNGWGEYPPIGRQYQIQIITAGKLKAEGEKAAWITPQSGLTPHLASG
jgi:hypothetical protein